MIGYVRCECHIYDAHSLKDKRSVLKRMIMRLRQRLNLSVAETDFQNLWQRTEISFVTISSDRVIAEQEITKAFQLLDSFPEIEITTMNTEWL